MSASTVSKPLRILRLVDNAGRELGRVRGLYVSVGVEPLWGALAVLRVGWLRRRVAVPLAGARYRSGLVHLAFPAERIRSAPRAGRGPVLTSERAGRLRAHYRLGPAVPARRLGDTEFAALCRQLAEGADLQQLLSRLTQPWPPSPAPDDPPPAAATPDTGLCPGPGSGSGVWRRSPGGPRRMRIGA
ncbi:MAG: hypothetical protein ACRDQ5_10660 [Sciscionella sp.]